MLLPFLLLVLQASGQGLGQNPNGQEWQELNTAAVKLIFPKGLEKQAQEIAKILKVQAKDGIAIDATEHGFHMILHNRSVEPNGFVSLGPFVSEIYGSPPANPQTIGSLNWINALSIHEYRHVQQNYYSRQGISKLGYYLGGQWTWAFLRSIAVPNWYMEGDAVLTETRLSESGRGRTASFLAPIRAISAMEKAPTYDQTRNGSFKKFIPSHYVFGYAYLQHLNGNFDASFQKEIFKDAVRYRRLFYPFSRALKRYTGLNSKSLHKATLKEIKESLPSLEDDESLLKLGLKEDLAQFHFPRVWRDSLLLALKHSNDKTTEIISWNGIEIKSIARPGYAFDRYFHASNKLLTWTTINLDIRRPQENYSDIVLYQIEEKKRIVLSKKGRYFSPIISQDETQVFSIAQDRSLNYSIVSIAIADKSVKNLHQFETGVEIFRINEMANKQLVYVKKKDNQMALFALDLKTGEEKQLIDWTYHVLDAPYEVENKVYYSASYRGLDEIHCLDLESLESKRLGGSHYGAYYPNFDEKKKELYFCTYTSEGLKLASLNVNDDLKQVKNENFDQIKPLPPVSRPLELEKDRDQELEAPKAYKGFLKDLKLHSWPITASPSTQRIDLKMQNLLQHYEFSAGALYNINESSFGSVFGGSYAKYFPVLDVQLYDLNRKSQLFFNRRAFTQEYREQVIQAGLRIPLQGLRGNYRWAFTPSVYYQYHQLRERKIDQFQLNNQNFQVLQFNSQVSYLRRKAVKQILPKWGIYAGIEMNQALGNTKINKLSTEAGVYFPGLLRNHGFHVNAAFQLEELNNDYQFSDFFNYPRGYLAAYHDEFRVLRLNYSLPLFYPDVGIAGITYFKRIRANLFIDIGEGGFSNTVERPSYRSVGAELIFDNQLMRLAPISIGLRASHLLDNDPRGDGESWAPGLFLRANF